MSVPRDGMNGMGTQRDSSSPDAPADAPADVQRTAPGDARRTAPGSVPGPDAGSGPDLAAHADALAAALTAGRAVTVVGAPGTGKTALLLALHTRLAALPATGPDDTLVLTPTRDHASELRDRLALDPGRVRTAPAARSIHSLAFGIVSAHAAVRDGAGTKFVSGADQDALLAALLEGYEQGRAAPPAWPAHMTAEVRRTRGFRDELREVLNRVMERGCAPAEVLAAARTAQRPEWTAVAQVLQDYEDQLAVPVFGGVDTAAVLAEAAAVLREERAAGTVAGGRWSFSGEIVPRFVLVDAAQDLPDAAVAVLSGLRDLGTLIAVAASPDTGTQGFRGGSGSVVAAVTVQGAPAITGPAGHRSHVLDPSAGHVRGAGAIAAVSQDFARRISTDLARGHVPREAAGAPGGDSRVRVARSRSAAEQSRTVAALLRTWFHDAGTDWSQIAVIGRTSGTAAALRQELGHLGIPVGAVELPLRTDPATATLLRALTVDHGDPEALDALVRELLTGPYLGVDPIALRGLEREAVVLLARRADDTPDSAPDGAPDSAGDSAPDDGTDGRGTPHGFVLVRALQEVPAAELPDPLRTLAAVLDTAAESVDADAHTAVWRLWRATGVARAWRARALSSPGDPINDRLDAVLRLISLAEKLGADLADRESLRARSFAALVADQEFAQDSLAARRTQAAVAVDSPAALAHRSFSRVVVVDVDEGQWPDPRVRGSMFATDALLLGLTGGEPDPDPGVEYARRRRATIVDEGRLFLSAITRAADELVVMALEDGDTSPSTFFDTVAVHPAAEELTAPAPVPDGGAEESAEGTAEVRGDGAAGDLLPVSARQAAARARGRFVAAADSGADTEEWADLLHALADHGVAEAAPENWTAWQEVTTSAPLLGPEDEARISPSVAEDFTSCALRWFLTRHGGRTASSRAQSLGTLIHAIAESHPRGGFADMIAEFDAGFAEIAFDAAWERDREYATGRRMVENLDRYLRESFERRPGLAVAVEVDVDAAAPAGAPGAPWRITGRIDRLEIIPGGAGAPDRVRPVDFKTGKSIVSRADGTTHPQLGVYQFALRTGGAERADGTRITGEPAGAELVYLRNANPTLREQPALDDAADPAWAQTLVGGIAEGMRSARFVATPSPDICRSCPVRSSCPAFADAPDAGAEDA